jgi:hypothetical protein
MKQKNLILNTENTIAQNVPSYMNRMSKVLYCVVAIVKSYLKLNSAK